MYKSQHVRTLDVFEAFEARGTPLCSASSRGARTFR